MCPVWNIIAFLMEALNAGVFLRKVGVVLLELSPGCEVGDGLPCWQRIAVGYAFLMGNAIPRG